MTQQSIDLVGQLDLLRRGPRVRRGDRSEQLEQLRARARQRAERLEHVAGCKVIVPNGVPMEIVFERRLCTRMRRPQRRDGPNASNKLHILDLSREREAVEKGDEAPARQGRHGRAFQLVDFGQLLGEFEMALLGCEHARAGDGFVRRHVYEPLLGIFVLAGEGLLLLPVVQVETTTQPGNVIGFGVGDGRRQQVPKLLDHCWRN